MALCSRHTFLSLIQSYQISHLAHECITIGLMCHIQLWPLYGLVLWPQYQNLNFQYARSALFFVIRVPNLAHRYITINCTFRTYVWPWPLIFHEERGYLKWVLIKVFFSCLRRNKACVFVFVEGMNSVIQVIYMNITWLM